MNNSSAYLANDARFPPKARGNDRVANDRVANDGVANDGYFMPVDFRDSLFRGDFVRQKIKDNITASADQLRKQ